LLGPGPSVQNMQDQKPWTVPEFTGSEECCLCCSRVQWLCSCMFICCCKPFQIIQSYENGVVLRYGKRLHEKTLGGGMHIILPSADQLLKIDIREQVMDLPKQQCLSREGVNLTVDGVIYYKVFDANRALLGVQNVRDALKNMALTKVRETVATHTVDQINLERQTLADNLTKALDTEAERWGIDVTKLLLTEVAYPREMQAAKQAEAEAKLRALAQVTQARGIAEMQVINAEFEAKQQVIRAEASARCTLVSSDATARAKLLESDGEKKAAQSFTNAATIMAQAPGTLQLRFLGTLNTIGAAPSTTILVPSNGGSSDLTSLIGNMKAIGGQV